MLSRRRILAGFSGFAAVLLCEPALAQQALAKVVVTKDPSCGCCSGWAKHMQAAGFTVDIVTTSDIDQVKARLGVPSELVSCHTAEVAGYVVEGHVPAHAVKRLLLEKPRARGLAVPAMPVGSPGMEVSGMAPDAFDIILFGPSGQATFGRYRGSQPV
jgi:hypothetical protein